MSTQSAGEHSQEGRRESPSTMERLAAWLGAREILMVVIVVGLFMGPALLGSGTASWHRDWHYFQHQGQVARGAVLAGIPPDFNPWHCGGADMAENAQDLSTSPLFLLVLFFGSALGLRMAALVLVLLGAAGMAWGMRRAGMGKLETWFAGTAWGLCVFLHVHISEGHVPFAGFALMPLVLALMAEAHRENALGNGRRVALWVGAGGVALGSQLLFGGAYAFPFTCAAMGLDALVRALRAKNLRPFVPTVAVGGVGILFAAPKLFPVLALLQRLPRTPLWTDALDFPLLGALLFSRRVSVEGVAGHPYDWPEYALYPGACVLLLALLGGLMRAPGTQSASISEGAGSSRVFAWVLVVVGFWLMLGDLSFGLRRLVAHLPLMGDLQVPSRYGVLFVFGCVLLAAHGLRWLRARGKAGMWAAAALALMGVLELGTLDLAWYGAAVEAHAAPSLSPGVPERAGALKEAPTRMDHAPDMGVVVTNCYEPGPHQLPSSLAAGEDLPFLRTKPSVESVAWQQFAPGLMVLQNTSESSAELLFAQAGGDNWRAEGGTIHPRSGGLLSVHSDGSSNLRVQYWNNLRMYGFLVQGLLLLWLLSRVKIRRTVDG